MSFASDMDRFIAKTEKNLDLIRDGVDTEVFTSIVEGSPITGAPGQPFDPDSSDENAGKLRDSWTMEKQAAETVVSTHVDYALDVEENTKGAHFRNHGPHSVKMTVAGFNDIVGYIAQLVVA